MRDRSPHDLAHTELVAHLAHEYMRDWKELVTEGYQGMTIASTPEDRHAADTASNNLWSRVKHRIGLNSADFQVYEWEELRYTFPEDARNLSAQALQYRFPDVGEIEQLLIDCGYGFQWNSSLGGLGGPHHLVIGADLQVVLDEVCLSSLMSNTVAI